MRIQNLYTISNLLCNYNYIIPNKHFTLYSNKIPQKITENLLYHVFQLYNFSDLTQSFKVSTLLILPKVLRYLVFFFMHCDIFNSIKNLCIIPLSFIVLHGLLSLIVSISSIKKFLSKLSVLAFSREYNRFKDLLKHLIHKLFQIRYLCTCPNIAVIFFLRNLKLQCCSLNTLHFLYFFNMLLLVKTELQISTLVPFCNSFCITLSFLTSFLLNFICS